MPSKSLSRRRVQGFSLIELLIVVAIIAALVGVAVPFFQDNLSEAQQAKAGQDLEIIKKAVTLYEQKEGVLTGTSLRPLLGRYMGQIPDDPWGNPYLYDGSLGFLGTYGADALPGGDGADADIIRGGYSGPDGNFPVQPVFLRRVQYSGPWGRPRVPSAPHKYDEGSKFILTFTRPLSETDPTLSPDDVVMHPGESRPNADSVVMSDPTSWHADTWVSAADPVWSGSVDPAHRPDLGVLVLRANVDNLTNLAAFSARPSNRVNIRHPDDAYTGVPVSTPLSFETTYVSGADPASPLDPAVYGTGVDAFAVFVGGSPDGNAGGLSGIAVERY